MLAILTITFPFFALVACGYLAARCRMLALSAIPGLNSFVLFFALPCMLYRFGASAPLAELLAPQLALTYLLCALLMVSLCLWLTRRGRTGWNDAAFGALVAAFPNTGFMGVPLLVAQLGQAAATPVIVSLVVDMVVTSSLCIALSRLGLHVSDGAPHASAAEAAAKALRGVAANPLPWAIFAGACVSWLHWELPQPVGKTLGLLADAASPVALFTIGAVLARSQILSATDRTHAVPWQAYLPVAALKLFVHPALVWGVGSAAIALGIALHPFALKVLVLLAALPSASNVVLLAERYGADSGRIARIILASTVAAFFTFSGAVALLSVR
ncbi:AEC family transporter [Rhodoferax sp. GW822-FHT02A01]|uniref:AEC family transporter n=1 Tax=Rhodoferax sp. GW822-FHT02A01 TaxID=3141537 RepID=UPI00315C853E